MWASHCVKDAEEMASRIRRFVLLDMVNRFQIDHAIALDIRIADLRDKALENSQRNLSIEKLHLSHAFAREMLNDARKAGESESNLKMISKRLLLSKRFFAL